MPMYNFKCTDPECGEITPKLQKYEDPNPPCKKCEKPTERVLSQSSFVLKGPGWFNTGGY